MFANKDALMEGAGAIFVPFSKIVGPRVTIVPLRLTLQYVVSNI